MAEHGWLRATEPRPCEDGDFRRRHSIERNAPGAARIVSLGDPDVPQRTGEPGRAERTL
jgi:hypothetical protein